MASTYIYDYVKFRPHFDTLADLTADTSLAYAATGNKYRVDTGDYVTAGSSDYVVIASGGTAHETTAGGVKLMEAGPNFSTLSRFTDWQGEGYAAQEGAIVFADGIAYEYQSSSWVQIFDTSEIGLDEAIIIACSDETTALTSGTAKRTFRMPYAFTVTDVRATLTTAQTSGSIFTVDINESGTTILSTKLTIDNGEETSTTAATAAVISDSALADDAEITIDIDQIGDGTAAGLKVTLIGIPA